MVGVALEAAGGHLVPAVLSDPPVLPVAWRKRLAVRFVDPDPEKNSLHEALGRRRSGARPQAPTDCDHDLEGLYIPEGSGRRRAEIRVFRHYRVQRRNFTLLHEIGHFIQHHDVNLLARLIEFDDDGYAQGFEEQACNLFASIALLPDDAVHPLTGDGITAQDAMRLYRRGVASRQVVARRLAAVMTAGWVTVFDARGRLTLRAHAGGANDYDGDALEPERRAVMDLHYSGEEYLERVEDVTEAGAADGAALDGAALDGAASGFGAADSDSPDVLPGSSADAGTTPSARSLSMTSPSGTSHVAGDARDPGCVSVRLSAACPEEDPSSNGLAAFVVVVPTVVGDSRGRRIPMDSH